MSAISPRNSFDTVIIGAGALGLWAARYAIGEGRSVCVVEKDAIGAGASGGFMGALMGHVPDGWNIIKQFQFEALDMLEGELARLREDTGVDPGYHRCGRVMPLAHEGMVGHLESWLHGAQTNWQGRYMMEYLEPGNDWFSRHRWPCADMAPFGAAFDTFAARVSPRGVIKALGVFASRHGEVRQGCEVTSISPGMNEVVLADGVLLKAGEIIVANGVDAYRLLHPFMGPQNDDKPIGRGVRGQAVMVEFAHDGTLPILYQDGTYIVPQQENRIAIGATSHNMAPGELSRDWEKFDPLDMAFYEKATKLAPMLKDAPIFERWSGVRPRNTLKGRGADPWFEQVPGFDNLIALIGGFKITFGIAHRAMDVARGKIAGPRRQKLSWVQ